MQVRDRIKKLKRVKASSLKRNAKNWRTHPEAQQSALRGVLEEVGYAQALVARELEDGSLELIDGHLRADTAADAMVPVLILDVTEEEADKLLASMDPIGAMAKTDTTALQALLSQIDDGGDWLKAIHENVPGMYADATGGLTDPDDIPAPPDEAITQPGDLWILGDHRLLCGDSSKPEDVDRLLDGAVIHLVNTDPPYNVNVEPRSNNAIAAGLSSFTNDGAASRLKGGQGNAASFGVDHKTGKPKHAATHKKLRAKDRPLVNDFVSDEAFDQLLEDWFGNIARVLLPGRCFYIWGGYANCGNYPPVLKKHGLYFSQSIIWDKQHPVLTRKDFMGAHEWAFYGWKEGAGHKYYGPKNATDLWQVKKVNPQSMIHLTEKPTELAVLAMQYSSKPGENVLDLFGGSGSTLIAAEQTGRRAYLMELDALYSDIIVQRWEQFTGKKANLEKGRRKKAAVVA